MLSTGVSFFLSGSFFRVEEGDCSKDSVGWFNPTDVGGVSTGGADGPGGTSADGGGDADDGGPDGDSVSGGGGGADGGDVDGVSGGGGDDDASAGGPDGAALSSSLCVDSVSTGSGDDDASAGGPDGGDDADGGDVDGVSGGGASLVGDSVALDPPREAWEMSSLPPSADELASDETVWTIRSFTTVPKAVTLANKPPPPPIGAGGVDGVTDKAVVTVVCTVSVVEEEEGLLTWLGDARDPTPFFEFLLLLLDFCASGAAGDVAVAVAVASVAIKTFPFS